MALSSFQKDALKLVNKKHIWKTSEELGIMMSTMRALDKHGVINSRMNIQKQEIEYKKLGKEL